MISSRSDYRESKSVQNGGDPMATKTTSGSKGIGRSRFLASIAMLFGAIFTILLLPAYGQQEVDPAWYDPWAAPSTAVAVAHPSQPPAIVHSSQPSVATERYQQKSTTVSLAPGAGRFRGRDTQLDQSRHNAPHKSGGTPSADGRLPGTACLEGFKTWDAASVPHGGVASRSA